MSGDNTLRDRYLTKEKCKKKKKLRKFQPTTIVCSFLRSQGNIARDGQKVAKGKKENKRREREKEITLMVKGYNRRRIMRIPVSGSNVRVRTG